MTAATRLYGGVQNLDLSTGPYTFEYVVHGPAASLEPWSEIVMKLGRAINYERRKYGLARWHGWQLGILWEQRNEDGRAVATTSVRDVFGKVVGTVTLIWPKAEDLGGER